MGSTDEKPRLNDALGRDDETRDSRVLDNSAHETMEAGSSMLTRASGDSDATVESGGAANLRGSTHEQPGQMIGRYKLLHAIGEGGFGVVYMAEQEQPVRRRVALKIIKLGMDTHQVIARFEAERQALALMDHPHIAKVLDAGSTETGRPYFVMELVKGVPILECCDAEKLNNTARLELFSLVCQAIQHAHQKGIIHRDIKPSNVLVTMEDGAPVPKVIDFGIAKAAGSEMPSTNLTEQRQMIGTPAYMSPEQAEGSLDIDTRTDIYSLGVLLYQLLTGTTPFDSKELMSKGFADMMRIIREVEPHKPSTRISALGATISRTAEQRQVDPRQLRSALRGDLDWIVMKCLEKDRSRRYETANGLAADIKRHLSNEPVAASPPSPSYRIKKFVLRHKLGVTAAGVVVLAIALGITGTAVSLVRAVRAERLARSEADRANKQARTSEETLNFLVGLFEIVDPNEARGNSVTAREILERGAARIDKELAGQPEVQATLMSTIAVVYRELGLYSAAKPLFERALSERRKIFRGSSPAVAATLNNYAELLVKAGEFDVAEPLYREALAMRRAVFGEEHADVAESLHDLAYLLCQKGDFAAAEPLNRQALEMRKRLLGHENRAVADSLHNLAMNLYDQGDAEAPVALLREALAMRRKLFGQVHPDIVESLSSLALVLYERGEFAQAEPLFREALDIQKRLVGEVHPDVAMAMNNLAFVLQEAGNYAAAESMYREVLTIQGKLLGENHPDIAKVLNNLAAVLRDEGDMQQAVRCARESLDMYRRVHGEEHPDVALALNNLARLLHEKGDTGAAESMYREATAMRRKLLGDKHPATAIGLTGLGHLLVETGRFDEALKSATEAREILATAYSESHWRTRVAEGVIGAALAGLGKFDEAEPLLLRSFDAVKKEKAASMYRTDASRRLVQLYEKMNRPDEAARYQGLAKTNADTQK